MNTNTIPVSVIIPLYNSGKYLNECITSINDEETKPSEIIIIDDCSTDDSLDIAHKIASNHSNIKILKTTKNCGAAGARKIGFMAAKEDLVAIIDSDDFLEKNAISDAYSKFNKDIDLCIWEMWRYVDSNTQYVSSSNPDELPLQGSTAVHLTLDQWKMHPLGVARKHIYIDAYKYLDVESYNLDELITRIILNNSKSIVGSKKKYYYRINPTSTTQSFSNKHLTALRSQIWLINFSLNIKSHRVGNVIAGSISTSYNIFKKRNDFNRKMFLAEMNLFAKEVLHINSVRKYLLFHPKYAGWMFFMYTYLLTCNTIYYFGEMLSSIQKKGG